MLICVVDIFQVETSDEAAAEHVSILGGAQNLTATRLQVDLHQN
jgi:hypothetical protein